MKYFHTLVLTAALIAGYNSDKAQSNTAEGTTTKSETQSSTTGERWKGRFSNRMKSDIIHFDVKDNKLQNLTFEGYWRCDDQLDLTTFGSRRKFCHQQGNSGGCDH